MNAWKAACGESDTDVYVVPIPYYYKECDGRLRNMQYDHADYPDNIRITYYEEFDLKLLHPDVIYIQNPYDEHNPSTSIPPKFYSSTIKNHTDKLIYIPYFTLNEFDLNDQREYWNMQYYCTVPGVVNADVVYVQS